MVDGGGRVKECFEVGKKYCFQKILHACCVRLHDLCSYTAVQVQFSVPSR